jgi:CRISPR-associated endonuclease/helicase Cas3
LNNPGSPTRTQIEQFRQFFATLSREGSPPYSYQERTAEALWRRQNLILRAPTGAGKTLAVLAPFLYSREAVGACRLIYALPLRTLAQGIYAEAQSLATRLGGGLRVTMQTGEQPDDPFFALGDIIVTTYDQVLSGLLCGPYGLPQKLRNINGALPAGNLIVFDEFHLMQTDLAFLTAVACLQLFGRATRSVWMTATATTPLTSVLSRALDACELCLSPGELEALPSVARVSRKIVKTRDPLTAEAVLAFPHARNLVIVNRVSRAQELARQITALLLERGLTVPVEVLHARFFRPDRKAKQAVLETRFGRNSSGPAILITTQVVEAGINITSDHLHTEICPMNALVQRAGRCARFPGENGTVHVYPVNRDAARPYDPNELETAWRILPEEAAVMDPRAAAQWVNAAHQAGDAETLERHKVSRRACECQERIWNNLLGQNQGGVADLIRGQTDTVQVAVCDDPRGRMPGQLESVSLYRSQLRGVLARDGIWIFDAGGETGWLKTREQSELDRAYAIAIPRASARYTPEFGLELGSPGHCESPARQLPARPGYKPLARESWAHHTKCVMAEARRRLDAEAMPNGLLLNCFDGALLTELVGWTAILHDAGKLQKRWQEWAEAAQRARDAAYRHTELLAHTDFDAGDPADRAAARVIRPPRPHHSTAGAFYGCRILERAGSSLPPVARAACVAAVLSHHGGWAEREVWPLDPRWKDPVKAIRKELASLDLAPPSPAGVIRLLHTELSSICLDEFAAWWPLASYLTRTLRLSDQMATEERNQDA